VCGPKLPPRSEEQVDKEYIGPFREIKNETVY
jgi:hypothetical protein